MDPVAFSILKTSTPPLLHPLSDHRMTTLWRPSYDNWAMGSFQRQVFYRIFLWGDRGTFCALIMAKKIYKQCWIFMLSKSRLSLMAPHVYSSPSLVDTEGWGVCWMENFQASYCDGEKSHGWEAKALQVSMRWWKRLSPPVHILGYFLNLRTSQHLACSTSWNDYQWAFLQSNDAYQTSKIFFDLDLVTLILADKCILVWKDLSCQHWLQSYIGSIQTAKA